MVAPAPSTSTRSGGEGDRIDTPPIPITTASASAISARRPRVSLARLEATAQALASTSARPTLAVSYDDHEVEPPALPLPLGTKLTALALLQSPQPPPLSACLAVLLHDLESRAAQVVPIVVVLDDYQVISDPAIHESLTCWLEHLPALTPAFHASARPTLPVATLSRRELDVLRLLVEGASNHEIAQTLMIELSTAKNHVSNLLSKLGATSRTQAIALARAGSLL